MKSKHPTCIDVTPQHKPPKSEWICGIDCPRIDVFEDSTLQIKKLTAYIQATDEQLMDVGAIPDTRLALPPSPWRRRLRWWIEVQRERLGELIAGRRFEDHDY